MSNATIVKSVLGTVYLLVMFGSVIPTLISDSSVELPFMGVVLVIVHILGALVALNNWISKESAE
jgi:hypothetical protein